MLTGVVRLCFFARCFEISHEKTAKAKCTSADVTALCKGGKYDMNSAFGGKADIARDLAECPLNYPKQAFLACSARCFRLAQLEQFARIAIVSQEWRRDALERWRMISATWRTLKDVVLSFIGDEALPRGAAIAFYTAT